MSPEQLQGGTMDGRSDIFSFGAVLYQMLTGKRAFPGNNPPAVIAEIIGKEPAPIAQSRGGIPASLVHVVELCLAKEPQKRWHSATDVAHELRWIAELETAPKALQKSPRRFVLPAVAALAIGLLTTAAAFLSRGMEKRPIAASVLPPVDTEFTSTTEGGSIAVDRMAVTSPWWLHRATANERLPSATCLRLPLRFSKARKQRSDHFALRMDGCWRSLRIES
jgi:serine/threonine protein kinase